MSCLSFVIAVACIITVGGAANTGRIIGGNTSRAAQFPYQISLRMNNAHICGGSIIASNYILTAAHCVVKTEQITYDAKYFKIRAGTHNRIAGGVIVPVKRISVHNTTDIAVLELENHLVFSEKIRPIAMATEEVPAGSKVIASGWGLDVNKGDSLPIQLKWTFLKVITSIKCVWKLAMPAERDSLLCLDHPIGEGTCQGDSGGPAVYNGTLVGVAGFGIIKCGGFFPDGYGKVSYNIDWIREQMK